MPALDTITDLLGQGAVIGVHLLSLHSNPTYVTEADFFGRPLQAERFETVTPGVSLRLANGATFGAYRNSYGRGSAYAGWTFETADQRWALTVGAVTGYPGRPVAPLVVPSLRLGLDAVGAPGWSARIALIPKPPTHGHGITRTEGTAALHIALEKAL